MPDATKDLQFLLTIAKTGSLTIDYDAASTELGWTKAKCRDVMCRFRMFDSLFQDSPNC